MALAEGYGPEHSSVYDYQLDHLGTPREMTDAARQLIRSATSFATISHWRRTTDTILFISLRPKSRSPLPERAETFWPVSTFRG
ncbi:RHS domain-containing protein [Marinobacter sp. JSM 1782161]|uniref:RHS domain-containing protein n=1 Tax=Marinobacter sp. JSM 1782161 TaxID=2685906 RepID=UPI003A4C6DE8